MSESFALAQQRLLHQYWGAQFQLRGEQPGVVEAIAQGRDVLALLPTGEGKSLCFQLGGLLRPGIKLVVSPLIALMQDQVAQLARRQVPVWHLQGGLKPHQRQQLLRQALQQQGFIYLSPEQLLSSETRRFFQAHPPGLVVIDEAHCISQWGHDFRPAYRQVAAFVQGLPERPPMAAFTATAPPRVAEDIAQLLALQNPYRVKGIPIQPFIHLAVKRLWTPAGKYRALQQALQAKTLIYARTRQACEDLAQRLADDGRAVAVFHAGKSSAVRAQLLQQFVQASDLCMVATKAFGMGIDIKDIQRVIHWQLPESLSAYVQEVGRAGRDRVTRASGVLLALRGESWPDQGLEDDRVQLFVRQVLTQARWSLPAFQHRYQWNLNDLNLLLLPLILANHVEIQQDFVSLRQVLSRRELTGLLRGHVRDLQRQRKVQQREMQHFVTARGCRRVFLYRVFDQPLPDQGCGQCDHCQVLT